MLFFKIIQGSKKRDKEPYLHGHKIFKIIAPAWHVDRWYKIEQN